MCRQSSVGSDENDANVECGLGVVVVKGREWQLSAWSSPHVQLHVPPPDPQTLRSVGRLSKGNSSETTSVVHPVSLVLWAYSIRGQIEMADAGLLGAGCGLGNKCGLMICALAPATVPRSRRKGSAEGDRQSDFLRDGRILMHFRYAACCVDAHSAAAVLHKFCRFLLFPSAPFPVVCSEPNLERQAQGSGRGRERTGIRIDDGLGRDCKGHKREPSKRMDIRAFEKGSSVPVLSTDQPGSAFGPDLSVRTSCQHLTPHLAA